MPSSRGDPLKINGIRPFLIASTRHYPGVFLSQTSTQEKGKTVMTDRFLGRAEDLQPLRVGPIGPHLQGFAALLSHQGYCQPTGSWPSSNRSDDVELKNIKRAIRRDH
jgi:hypothetical protein